MQNKRTSENVNKEEVMYIIKNVFSKGVIFMFSEKPWYG